MVFLLEWVLASDKHVSAAQGERFTQIADGNEYCRRGAPACVSFS
jgi:hypothetical protein